MRGRSLISGVCFFGGLMACGGPEVSVAIAPGTTDDANQEDNSAPDSGSGEGWGFSQSTGHDLEARLPIVFVHGFSGKTKTNFKPFIAWFKADGWPAPLLHAYDYDSLHGCRPAAVILRDKVEQILAQTGKAKVDIVAHSMGGLVVRHYLKALGGREKVDDFVAIATPHEGSTWAHACFFLQSCRDMTPGSDFLKELGGAACGKSLWSSCDELVLPHHSAQCGESYAMGCYEHNALMWSSKVYQATRDLIRSTGP